MLKIMRNDIPLWEMFNKEAELSSLLTLITN